MVESQPSKLLVAGSIPVSRSILPTTSTSPRMKCRTLLRNIFVQRASFFWCLLQFQKSKRTGRPYF
jgi:hypothetical protein